MLLPKSRKNTVALAGRTVARAAIEAGTPLSIAAKISLTLIFLEERQQTRRTQINAKEKSARSRRKREFEARDTDVLIEISRSINSG